MYQAYSGLLTPVHVCKVGITSERLGIFPKDTILCLGYNSNHILSGFKAILSWLLHSAKIYLLFFLYSMSIYSLYFFVKDGIIEI